MGGVGRLVRGNVNLGGGEVGRGTPKGGRGREGEDGRDEKEIRWARSRGGGWKIRRGGGEEDGRGRKLEEREEEEEATVAGVESGRDGEGGSLEEKELETGQTVAYRPCSSFGIRFTYRSDKPGDRRSIRAPAFPVCTRPPVGTAPSPCYGRSCLPSQTP